MSDLRTKNPRVRSGSFNCQAVAKCADLRGLDYRKAVRYAIDAIMHPSGHVTRCHRNHKRPKRK